MKNENDTSNDFDDELSIPELGSGEDHTLPGLGSLQCLATEPLDEESKAKPLRPSYLGSVPDGLGALETSASNLDSKIPPRLGKSLILKLICKSSSGAAEPGGTPTF